MPCPGCGALLRGSSGSAPVPSTCTPGARRRFLTRTLGQIGTDGGTALARVVGRCGSGGRVAAHKLAARFPWSYRITATATFCCRDATPVRKMRLYSLLVAVPCRANARSSLTINRTWILVFLLGGQYAPISWMGSRLGHFDRF